MTSGHRTGEAILALARELRRAVSNREETMQSALIAYNHAGGYRLDYAATFLQTIQRADATYEERSSEALRVYRERIELE